MAINLKFDLMGNPEPPSIVLASRSGEKFGQLNVNAESIDVLDKFNDASEFSFTLNKYIDGELTPHWDKVVDFKLVYCPEWDVWFEIKVELDETTETVKTVFCTQLGQAELSQTMLYNIEINTDVDIEREDFKTSILCDENNPKSSILHRLLEKAPHYSIAYVDESIQRIQRKFSFDETSICDAFNEIAEEIGCLFVYNSNTKFDGSPNRTISVYDLQQNCNDCGHRGEFTDKCPECGSTNIKYGYGEDTTIFVTSDELATEGIELVTDTDAVKNCFKLEAGDDLMTAAIRSCNPNGSDYIWYFSDGMKEDMSDELVDKLNSYDDLYKYYYNNHVSILNSAFVNNYNALAAKYKGYYDTPSTCLDCHTKGYFQEQCTNCNSKNILTGQSLQFISSAIIGYPDLMTAYYNTIDLDLYLESGLMPNVNMSDTTAVEQLSLLTTASLSPVAVNVTDITNASLTTANSAVLSMAKVLIRPTYKVSVVDNSSSLSGVSVDGKYRVWTGQLIVTNYSDENDSATSGIISVQINNDIVTFIEQKIEKALNKENTDDYSITGLFAKEYTEFCAELKKYALNPLNSFSQACDVCLSILLEQGVGDDGSNESNEDEKSKKKDLYDSLYKPYFDKHQAINDEIKIRQDEIAIIEGVWDKSDESNPVCVIKGLQQYIEECQKEIQSALNFENYLGANLWLEFCAYRREDKYSNDNYVSDGLSNAELFEKANEFIEVAEEEIFKSAELQHSISATLNNLLSLPKFKPLIKFFKTGNWIRVQADDEVYRLRLLEYGFNYGDSESVSVKFSDVTKIKNGVTDIQDIMSQASSMASSYDSIQKQAKQGDAARGTIDQWLIDGLDSANVRIKSNNNEEIVITKSGLLARTYGDITGTYSPEQFKLTHNIMAYTEDGWETVSTALGKHNYKYWDGEDFIDAVGYGMSAKFAQAAYLIGSQMIGGEIISSNYVPREKGTYINLIDGNFDFAGGKIVFNTTDDSLTLKDVTIVWDSNTNAPDIADISGLDAYLEQLDGRIQTYSQTTDPSQDWSSVEKTEHIGDLWFNPDDGLTKRWTGAEWETVTDSELAELAQSKAKIFTATPIPPYHVGDLWVQGSTGDIMHCVTARLEGESFNESDWAKSSKYTDDSALNSFISGEYADDLGVINAQIDKKAETWYQPSDPSSSWTTGELKAEHVGDLWHYTGETTGTRGKHSEWIWQKVNDKYQWVAMEVPDEVYDAIDGKSTIYTSKPNSQEQGDLLIPSSTFTETYNSTAYTFTEKKIYRCVTTSSIFVPSSWSEVAYTDDSALKDFISKEYADDLEAIGNQIDGKARAWYQSTDPSLTWDINEEHNGDLWYNSSSNSQITYIYSNNAWQATNVPKELFDTIDGIASIYVTIPTNPVVGDLLIPTSDTGNYKAGKVYRYNGSTWIEIAYTDDTLAKQALEQAKQGIADAATGINLANAAQSAADNAQTSADNAYVRAEDAETNAKNYAFALDTSLSSTLTDAYQNYTNSQISTFDSYVAKYLGLGGNTIIGQNYVISPMIAGGYLNITNANNQSRVIIDPNNLTGNGYIFQVHNGTQVSVGIDKNGNAEFNGHITATSLTIAPNANINGLDDYAKTDDVPTDAEIVTIAQGAITANYIKTLNLEVGNEITMGSGATISWNNVTEQPTILSEGDIKTTVITKDYIETLNIKAGSVDAENISGTTITGKAISGGSISIGNGAFSVNSNGYLTASAAYISGTLAAGQGSSIGGFQVDNNSIFSGHNGSAWDIGTGTAPQVFMCTGSNYAYTIGGVTMSGWCFGAGTTFGVTNSGSLYCTSGQIGGWIIQEGCLCSPLNSAGSYGYAYLYPYGIRWYDAITGEQKQIGWDTLITKVNALA